MDDYAEAYALWQATPGVGLSTVDERGPIATYLQRNPGTSFVARAEGRLVGAVLCGSDGRRGYLHHLAVAVDFRRQGVGEALVDGCLAGLKAQGIEKCHLFVFAGNTLGRAFWEHVSWRLRSDLVIYSREVA
jgi:putative acetyltransferase